MKALKLFLGILERYAPFFRLAETRKQKLERI
jgi:hypothetical protein